MIDKKIETLQKEELKLLNKQMEDLSKEKKKLTKLNQTQARIINKIVNKEFLRKYIEEDETISKIIEILAFCSFKVHRKTFKNFLKNEYTLVVDDMKSHELEAVASNSYKFEGITSKTIDKKLEELKILRLIEFEDDNYYIKATDLLITIIKKEYGRINNSIKNEKELIMETEDKLFAYRFTIESDYLTENKELINKFKFFNSIYTIEQNIFVLGRRGSEDLSALKRRVMKMIRSDLVDTSNIIDRNDNRYKELLEPGNENVFNLLKEHEQNAYIPIIIYISKKMKVNLNDIASLIVLNPVHIVRY